MQVRHEIRSDPLFQRASNDIRADPRTQQVHPLILRLQRILQHRGVTAIQLQGTVRVHLLRREVDRGGILEVLLQVGPGGVATSQDIEGSSLLAKGGREVTVGNRPGLRLGLESARELVSCRIEERHVLTHFGVLLVHVLHGQVDLVKLVFGIGPLMLAANREQDVAGPTAGSQLLNIIDQSLALLVSIEAL